jgi:SsrA-binding protein
MKIITKNRSAFHDYAIEKEYEAWLVLQWCEVKSIKTSHVNIKDAIINLYDKELWVVGMDVPLYEKTSYHLVPGYQPKWRRKVLVNKKELAKISSALDVSGTVLLPLEVFITHRGRIKMKIGLARLMRKVEKKQILKEKDIKRQMDREIKWLKM